MHHSDGPRHDPVALFAFALREGDWVLADLLARSFRHEGRTLFRFALVAGAPGRPEAGPGSLSDLALWARLVRLAGVGGG